LVGLLLLENQTEADIILVQRTGCVYCRFKTKKTMQNKTHRKKKETKQQKNNQKPHWLIWNMSIVFCTMPVGKLAARCLLVTMFYCSVFKIRSRS